VWEAVHRETGLPIVADYFTRIHRLSGVTVTDQTLFDALCTIGDALRVRWTKDGDFLLCRGTSYLWDKLKEVPDRYLKRWVADRNANGELPLADLVEMASLSDTQLSSKVVAEAIRHCWGVREWRHVLFNRRSVRFVAALTPDQRRRAMEPGRLPFTELTPAQQQIAVEMVNANNDEMGPYRIEFQLFTAEQGAKMFVQVNYVPAGRYVWNAVPSLPRVSGRTAEETLAAARQIAPEASPPQVRLDGDGYFAAGVTFDPRRAGGPQAARVGQPASSAEEDWRVFLDLEEVPIRDAVKAICDQAKREYLVDEDVPTSTRVTLHAQGIKLSIALDLLAKLVGLQWTEETRDAKRLIHVGKNVRAGSTH
jgi:hypothetical protein